MTYKDMGLVNTRKMFADALRGGYAVPAFNFYNMETLAAIMAAAAQTNSDVILSVSESALKYMGDNVLLGLVGAHTCAQGANMRPYIALHLDHGASFETCKHAVDIGFSSVMIDASSLPFDENITLTRHVVEYAHKHDVTVEAELGTLSGIEDDVSSTKNIYTNPDDVVKFVTATECDSLAIAIGTSHGAYKRKSATEELRFDILEKIAADLPSFPLVLHGASTIPDTLVQIINKNGGKIENARGIPADQIRRAVGMNICKVNIDSDGRLAMTAAIRKSLNENPANFDPRKYLSAGRDLMTQTYVKEIGNLQLV